MADVHLSPTAQTVLAIFEENRGLALTPADIAERADLSPSVTQATLDFLADNGLIEPQRSDAGITTAYIARG